MPKARQKLCLFSCVPILENLPSDSMSNPASLPPLIEGYGRKRKKRTSIETNIKLTLEKRFLDVSLTTCPLYVCLWDCCVVFAKFCWRKNKKRKTTVWVLL